MRLSDLLHAGVVDAEGRSMGRVVDVRLVQDGPVLEGFGAALRVEGMVVGRAGLGTRLGYYRGGVQGPRLLRALFLGSERKAPYVAWSDVEDWDVEAGRVKLRIGAEEARAHPASSE